MQRFLLANQQLCNAVNVDGETALIRSSRNGNSANVACLIAAGANVNKGGLCGNTALHYAAYQNHIEVVQLLVAENVDVNCVNDSGETALFWTLLSLGMANALSLLIEAGANVNHVDRNVKAPLHHAALQGNDRSIKKLIAAGADVTQKDAWGETPLHHACRSHIVNNATRTLLKAGADPNSVSDSGTTPLYYASKYLHSDSVRVLLRSGADSKFCITNSVLAAVIDFSRKTREQALTTSLLVNARKRDTCTQIVCCGAALKSLNLPVLLCLEICSALLPVENCIALHVRWKILQSVKRM